jgi:predicted transcriptional regulator
MSSAVTALRRVAEEGVANGESAGYGNQRRAPGSLAAEVLEVLRAADDALSPGEVRERLAAGGRAAPLSYSTVVTILSRLHDKGMADRHRVGRAYAYRAVADEAELAARRMRRVLDAEGDRGAVLARFVGDLSSRDELLLRELLGSDLVSERPDDQPAE